MSIEFAIGKQIVCVSDFVSQVYVSVRPVEGCVYTIRHIREFKGRIGFLLEEITNDPAGNFDTPGGEPDFDSKRFRPVRKTSIDCFTKLLETLPVRLKENV